MSASRPDSNVSSPVKRYLEWRGKTGKFRFYDKAHPDADEKGYVYFSELKFVVLDEGVNSVSGFNDETQSQLWSNMVRDIGVQELVVRDSRYKKIRHQGLWKEIGVSAKADGGHFTNNVFVHDYALAEEFKDSGETDFPITQIRVNKSLIGVWIEFQKKKRVRNFSTYKMYWDGTVIEKSKGTNEFKLPVFKCAKVDEDKEGDLWKLIIDEDEALQEYLDVKLQSRDDVPDETDVPEDTDTRTDPSAESPEQEDDDLPF